MNWPKKQTQDIKHRIQVVIWCSLEDTVRVLREGMRGTSRKLERTIVNWTKQECWSDIAEARDSQGSLGKEVLSVGSDYA